MIELSNTPGRRPADVLVDQYMREMTFSQLRALLLLYKHETLYAAATAVNESFNSLKNQILREDEWFRRNTGVELITHNSNRIVLTENGRWVASQLVTVDKLLQTALEGLEASSIVLQVPCTGDCIDDLARFIRNMSGGDPRLRFAPLPTRASEFNPMHCGVLDSPVMSLGAKYMSGSTLALPDYIDVLPIRHGRIVAVMNEDPEDPDAFKVPVDDEGAVGLQDLLRKHVKIYTTIGGVVWDFLGEHEPAVLDGLRNGTHLVVPDLHYGLKLLAARTMRGGAMLVHGTEKVLGARSPTLPLLENFKCYSLRESNDIENGVVTGLFYNQKAVRKCSSNVQKAYELLWGAAMSDLGRVVPRMR